MEIGYFIKTLVKFSQNNTTQILLHCIHLTVSYSLPRIIILLCLIKVKFLFNQIQKI